MEDKAKHLKIGEIPEWIDPLLYTWTTTAVHKMAGVWFLIFVPVMIMVDSASINLRLGLWYCVQPFLMYTVLSKQVSVLDTGDRAWDLTHSAAPFVTANTAETAVVTTWWRIIALVAMFVTDIVFLGIKVAKCFGASGCEPDATLYAVILLFVLAQALLCATMAYLLIRMPFSPVVWLRNPATLVDCSKPTGPRVSRIVGR